MVDDGLLVLGLAVFMAGVGGLLLAVMARWAS
jgi:hypothetical protein